ncbi:MAG: hypothetical protein EXS00_03950 [Phycisphaerales bacterium]|nr:hypothetical protein [Phycisphaerales bacterium]
MVLLECRPKIFSMVGSPASGKSYIITCACWRMRQTMPSKFGLSFTDSEPLINSVVNANEERLFLRENPHEFVHIEKTEMQGLQYNSVQFDPGQPTLLPHPFLFTMTPTDAHPNGAAKDELRQVLCLYDNAGEHFLPGADSATAPGTQHLARSRVILFVFDPTQDVRFRRTLSQTALDPQLRPGERSSRQDIVLSEMIDRVRSYSGMSAGQKLTQPLLVILSKSDAWEQLIPDEDLRSDPYAPGAAGGVAVMDTARIERVSAKLHTLMSGTVPEFVAAAEAAFSRVEFIPVSALGCAPTIDPANGLLRVRPQQVLPRWIDVPFTYAFARWSRSLVGTLSTRGRAAEPPALDEVDSGESHGD